MAAKTVVSSATSYLTAAEFLKRVDVRTVADLISDDGKRVGDNGDDTVNTTTVGNDANLAALLLDASGTLESACLMGGRYTSADLAALTGAGLRLMYRILTDLTMAYLIERRPTLGVQLPASHERSMAMLQMLAEGERIFGFQETVTSGQFSKYKETVNDVNNKQEITWHLRDFFGRRSNRIG